MLIRLGRGLAAARPVLRDGLLTENGVALTMEQGGRLLPESAGTGRTPAALLCLESSGPLACENDVLLAL